MGGYGGGGGGYTKYVSEYRGLQVGCPLANAKIEMQLISKDNSAKYTMKQ